MAGYRRRIKLIDLNKQWDVAAQQSSTYRHAHCILHFCRLQDEVPLVQCLSLHRLMVVALLRWQMARTTIQSQFVMNGPNSVCTARKASLCSPYASFASFTGPGQFDCISTGRWRVQNALVPHSAHFAALIPILPFLFLILSSESTTLRHQSSSPENSLARKKKAQSVWGLQPRTATKKTTTSLIIEGVSIEVETKNSLQ